MWKFKQYKLRNLNFSQISDNLTQDSSILLLIFWTKRRLSLNLLQFQHQFIKYNQKEPLFKIYKWGKLYLKNLVIKLIVILIFKMEQDMKENLILRVSFREMVSSIIQVEKYVIQEVGRIILLMDLEFFIMKIFLIQKKILHMNVLI